MERLLEMDNKLYMLSISIEGLEHMEEGRSDKDDDGDHGDDEDWTNEEGFDDLDDLQDSMDTEKRGIEPQPLTPREKYHRQGGTKTVGMCQGDGEADGIQAPDIISPLYQMEVMKEEEALRIERVLPDEMSQGVDVMHSSRLDMREESAEDSGQKLRWENFMKSAMPDQMESDFTLLKAMELFDEEGQISLDESQDKVLLDKNTVDRIAELRG
jgi:hypothetical protein